jgi:uncharacterized membrane protein YfcA
MLAWPTLGLLVVSVLGTSFISGIFGMAGGMVLVGVLLALFDVAPAMLLFGVTQTAANGWRCLLWRKHVRWSIVGGYALGSIVMFMLFRFIAYIPEKSVIYLGLGLTPFLVELLPRSWQPHIEQRGAPVFCGALIMVFQLIAGVAGNVLDLFFNKSPLDRKEIVATKAATQTLAHMLRVAYFGSISVEAFGVVPWWLYGLCIGLAFCGTTLASHVLNAMSDVSFKRWSRWIILAISGVYVIRGVLDVMV